MSKKYKKSNKEKRLGAKRAKKAANKARYQKLREQGINQKSLRSRLSNKKGKKMNTVSHPDGQCGNIGCRTCNPCNLDFAAIDLRQKVAA